MSRPTSKQFDEVVGELAAILVSIRTHGAEVLRRAEAGGLSDGYPRRSFGGGGSKGGVSDPVGSLVVQRDEDERLNRAGPDPTRRSANAMAFEMREMVKHGRVVVSAIREVIDQPQPAEMAPIGSRESDLALCAECGEPAPRVKRLDGAAYHHPDDKPCFWIAYNRSRGRRPSATVQPTVDQHG